MSYADTPEQAAIIDWKGERLVVKAFAGTGKTHTLVRYARANPESRMLYLAYNRAVRNESEQKFPFSVECKTSHQLAWPGFGRPMASRLTSNLRITDVARLLNTRHWPLARTALETLNHFLCSADPEPGLMHLPAGKDRCGVAPPDIIGAAQVLWQAMRSPQSDFPVTHDTYLKLYQLSDPDLSRRWGTILFDEAQDANPVTRALVLGQKCNVVLVGDRHQQIYRFRGADNALDAPVLQDADQLWLTQSFRFGPEVARVANVLLERQGETQTVKGSGSADRVVETLPADTAHYTVLSRTVAGVIGAALSASLNGKSVYWVGGIEGYKAEELEDLYWFSVEMPERMRSPQLTKDYRDFAEYESIAKATGDIGMNQGIRLLETYFPLPQKLKVLRAQAVKNESEADVTVSTAHRSKGLEWDTVVLDDDFADITDPQMPEAERTDETNLLYVSVTRARRTLVMNGLIHALLNAPDKEDEKDRKGDGGKDKSEGRGHHA
jgi:hypothetical protein